MEELERLLFGIPRSLFFKPFKYNKIFVQALYAITKSNGRYKKMQEKFFNLRYNICRDFF